VLALVGASKGVTILPAWTALAHAQQYDLITRPIGAEGLSINWYLAGLHQVANREAIETVMALIEKMSLIKH